MLAVMDAAGVEQAAILGFNDGGGLALQLAAAYPERCRSLVLWNTAARMTARARLPVGAARRGVARDRRAPGRRLGRQRPDLPAASLVPSRADDDALPPVAGRPRAHGASRPGTMAHFFRETVLADLRGFLAGRAGADARAAARARVRS